MRLDGWGLAGWGLTGWGLARWGLGGWGLTGWGLDIGARYEVFLSFLTYLIKKNV